MNEVPYRTKGNAPRTKGNAPRTKGDAPRTKGDTSTQTMVKAHVNQ